MRHPLSFSLAPALLILAAACAEPKPKNLDGPSPATEAGGSTPTPVPTAAPLYRGKTPLAEKYTFKGRFDVSDPNRPMMEWGSTGVGVHFSGSRSLAANLDNVQNRNPDNTLLVRVDGQDVRKITFTKGQTQYTLAENLDPGEHTVWVIHIQEFGFGPIAFGGFILDAGATLLPPPPLSARRIEFIGSSTLSGWGVDSPDYPPEACLDEKNFPTTNSEHGIPRYVADALQADFQNISRGAGGILVTFSPGVGTLPQAYPLVVDSSQEPWDSSQWQADAVVIEAGGSDFTMGDGPPATVPVGTLRGYTDASTRVPQDFPVSAFVDAYIKFITDLRARHPNAHIVLVNTKNFAGQSVEVFPQALDAIAAHFTDGKVHRFDYFKTPLAQPSRYPDYKAMVAELGEVCDGHTTREENQLLAARLAEFLRIQLKW